MAGMWALDTMALPSVKDNVEDASRSSENLTGVDQHAAESYPTAPKATDPVDTRQDFTEEALVKLEAAANSLPFAHFCDKCEKAAQAKSAQKKRSIFIDKELIYRLQRASPGPVSIFPILRLLLPETDPRQGQFKLRHRTMGDVIVKTLGLATKSEAALRIMNFSMPEHNGPRMGPNGRILNTLGDFGSTIEDVLVSRIRQTPSDLSLLEVNEWLDKLVSATPRSHAKRKEREREEIFTQLSTLLNPREMKWLIRIILGDLKCGFKKDSVLKVFGQDGPGRLQRSYDLRKVCAEYAVNVSTSYHLELMTPFQVQCAARASSVEDALRRMEGAAFVMEQKVDGERYVLHKRGMELRLVSRNFNAPRQEYYTALTPILLEGLGDVDDLILDGEIVAWSKRLGGFEKYGHNKTVAIAQAEAAAGVVRRREGGKEEGREGGEEDRNLMYVVFDCLHVGGQGSQEAFARAGVPKCAAGAVSGMPLSDRRALLQAVLSSLPRRLEIVAHREVPLSLSTRDVGRKGQDGGVEEARLEALSAYYDHAVENGWEGLMLKRLDSRYSSQGGENGEKISREKGGWVKLKPDYAEVTDEMDLVLLGGYYKDGARWRGYPSRFLLGVWAEGREGKEGGKEGGGTWEGMRFHTFARVATGLNTWEREELQNLLKAHWIEGGPGREFPPWIMPWKAATIDIPALWLDVRHAPMVVMSVKGAEMVPSRSYSVEWTLRFPRITRLRPDKALAGVMTVQELQALRERPGGLWGRQDGHAAKGGEKRGRGQGKEGGRKRRARWVPVSAYATPGGIVEAEVKGSLFAGMKICLYGSEFTTRLPNARALVGLEEGGKEGGKEGVRESGKEGWFSIEELHRVIVEQGGQASTNLMEIEKGPWDGGEGGEEEAGGVEGGRGGDPAVTSEGNRHPNPPFVSPVYGMDIQRSPSPGISKSPPQPQRYEQDVLLVPAGRPCLRTQAAMREARIDILVVDWMVECLGAGRRIEPRYEHYVGMARGTRRRMEGLVDGFGDPWIPREGSRLEEVFARMPSLSPSRGPSLSGAWRCHVREGAWGDDEDAILRGVVPFYSPRQIIYADRYADCGRVLPPVGEEDDEEATDDKEVGTREAKGRKRHALPFTTLDAAVILLRLHGAKISSSLHANVTHVLVDREERRRYSLILARKRELRRGPHYACEKWVVDVEWVKASLKAGRLLDLQEGGIEECEEGCQRYVVSDQELKEGAGME